MIISTGESCKSIKWKRTDITWGQLIKRLSQPVRTAETVAEYQSASRTRKAQIKDVGGFVGGELSGPRRTARNIIGRCLITLDVDHADGDFISSADLALPCAGAIYSTHSHTPENPRLRLIIPLDRVVSADEYGAIARRVAEDIGMAYFDHTTFDVNRLMYWPSAPSDGEYIFETLGTEPLCADDVLAQYTDWRDVAKWPTHPKERALTRDPMKTLGDPHEKPGVIGAFCREYTISAAIAAFLPDAYLPAGPGRYTYTGSESAAGLAVYENDTFAYSYQDSDPVSCGHCVNAWDLVRLHKFKGLDKDAKEDTPANRLPSYQAMAEFSGNDPAVKIRLADENLAAAKEEFSVLDDEEEEPKKAADPDKWKLGIERDKHGQAINSHRVIHYIMEHDPSLKGCIAHNEFSDEIVSVRNLPWRKTKNRMSGDTWMNADDVRMCRYLEGYSMNFTKANVLDQITDVAAGHPIHPVRDYLKSLEWDGVPRIDTLFIDRLGADDTPYVRTATRKMLTAGAARIMQPGIKMDCMAVLVGPQGIGKSSILRDLAHGWFTDSVYGIGTKEAAEQIQGFWIVELAELAAMKKTEVEATKSFISAQEDSYRAAYARRVEKRPRQCIFFGTTNSTAFLRDETGNRRFWPIRVESRYKRLTDDEIDQIWAEAVHRYKEGEALYLTRELEEDAKEQQEIYTIEDPWALKFAEFLDTPIPLDWYSRTPEERQAWFEFDHDEDVPTMLRDRVTASELWTECLEGSGRDIKRNMTAIHASMSQVPGWERGKKKMKVGGTSVRAYVRVSK